MYKTTIFSLVKPIDNKPVMLDDTCYFIGFETLIEVRNNTNSIEQGISTEFYSINCI